MVQKFYFQLTHSLIYCDSDEGMIIRCNNEDGYSTNNSKYLGHSGVVEKVLFLQPQRPVFKALLKPWYSLLTQMFQLPLWQGVGG